MLLLSGFHWCSQIWLQKAWPWKVEGQVETRPFFLLLLSAHPHHQGHRGNSTITKPSWEFQGQVDPWSQSELNLWHPISSMSRLSMRDYFSGFLGKYFRWVQSCNWLRCKVWNIFQVWYVLLYLLFAWRWPCWLGTRANFRLSFWGWTLFALKIQYQQRIRYHRWWWKFLRRLLPRWSFFPWPLSCWVLGLAQRFFVVDGVAT